MSKLDKNKVESIEDILILFLREGVVNLTLTKMNKLLFFLDFYGLNRKEKPQEFIKWNHVVYPYGPVLEDCGEVVKQIKKNGKLNYSSEGSDRNLMTFTLKKDSESQKYYDKVGIKHRKKRRLRQAIKNLAKQMGKLSSKKLSNFSHNFDVWGFNKVKTIIKKEDMKREDSFLKANGIAYFYKIFDI